MIAAIKRPSVKRVANKKAKAATREQERHFPGIYIVRKIAKKVSVSKLDEERKNG